ncbi:lysine transporter LysE [Flagellimonas aquimarina]|uniref:Lysine transporter LysE n=1 Tax=Flagellimonas aquimarina TaxID=2201895 RepID=A0A316L140_9FLAO|nr:LysE family transporter [Allomuricauda koreensis]PWL40237.1 lysine transporter LysE [Allomuricauda koreensis]
MTHLLILFCATFLAAFVASAPPGLLNVNAAKTSVEKGKSNGIIFGMGVAVMVIFQTYISVRIAKYLSRNPEVIGMLLQIALVVFTILAIFFFLKGKKQDDHPIDFEQGKKRSSFTKGLFLAAINLLTIPYYSGLNSVFHAQGLMNYEVIDEVIFILAAGLGTFLVMYLYAFYFNKMERKTNRFSKNSNYILSGLMLVLLMVTLIKIFYQ